MIEFLKGGVIKGRHRKYNDAEVVQQKVDIKRYRAKNLTDAAIAKKMKVSYFTVAEWGEPETRY